MGFLPKREGSRSGSQGGDGSNPAGSRKMSINKSKLDTLTTTLGVIVVIGVLFLGFAPDSIWHGGGVAPASEREATADFSLPDLDGHHWKLTEQRGRVVLVNYWATWCPPCRKETPGLVRLANEYRGKGVEVAGVSLDEDLTAVREFVAEYHISYPILLPSNTAYLPTTVESIPVSLLYDRHGRLAKRYNGAVSEATFKRDVAFLLAEK